MKHARIDEKSNSEYTIPFSEVIRLVDQGNGMPSAISKAFYKVSVMFFYIEWVLE